MTTPTESPADLDLPSLDASPACECDPECPRHLGESCSEPAVYVARMAHMIGAPDCRPIPRLTCLPCVMAMADAFRHAINTCQPAARCVVCHAEVRCVHDFITELIAL